MSTDALYPSMATPAAPAPEPAPQTLINAAPVQPEAAPVQPAVALTEEARLEASGERLFKKDPEPFVDSNAPEEVVKLREADPNRRMYSAQTVYATDLPDADFEALVGQEGPDGVPFTQEQAVYAAGFWREAAADLDLSPADVRELVPIFKAPPTPEQQEANRAASLKWLTETHADQAPFVLEAARALIARDPRTVALMNHSGMGDDPRVVRKIVAAALKQVASGKLKVPQK